MLVSHILFSDFVIKITCLTYECEFMQKTMR